MGRGCNVGRRHLVGDAMALHELTRDSAAWYLRSGKSVMAVTGAQAASPWLAALTGGLAVLNRNRYPITAVSGSHRDPGRGEDEHGEGRRDVAAGLPGLARPGPGTGLWHQLPAGGQLHRCLLDLRTSDAALTAA